MAPTKTLTETDVRALANDQSFDRGYRYYRNDSVFDLIRRGNMVTAKVAGSGYEPYHIEVNLGASGIESTMCSCPYDWGGICKHIVATLLTLIYKEDEIDIKPEIAILLNDFTDSQLRQLILLIAEEGSQYAEVIERGIKWIQATPTATAVANPTVLAIDINAVHREINKDFRLAGKGDPFQHGYYDEYAGLEVYTDDILGPHLEKVTLLLDAGQVDTAVALITAIFEAYIDGLTDLDEWVYEYNEDVFDEANLTLGATLAEIILSQTLNPSQEEDWLAQITDWEEALGDLEIATTALKHGWTYPPLVAAMAGNISDTGSWGDTVPYFADELSFARLRILSRRGETKAYINLATAEGQTKLAVNMLAQSGQVTQAVSEAKLYLMYPEEILSLSQVLVEKGDVAAALDVAEHGLGLEQNRGQAELAQWTRDQAQATNQQTLALKAAQVAFLSTYHLADYLAVQELSGQQWSMLKPALLKSMQKNAGTSKKIDIFLHEQLLVEAMQALDAHGYAIYRDIERVIEATSETYPNWGIGKCKQQAEVIINEGQAKRYDTAVSWLQIAKKIYLQHHRQQEWQAYLDSLLATHGRKYKLVPMLRQIR